MVSYHYQDVYDEKNAAEVILCAAPDNDLLVLSVEPPEDVDKEVAPMCVYRPMTAEQEFHLFRKMNYLKYLAESADESVERDDRLAHAMSVRNVILKHNTRLLYDIVKAYAKYSGHTTPELFSEAYLWMMTEIIDGFDFTKGVPFGAFVSQCVRRRLWTYLSRSYKARKRCGTDEAEAIGNVCDHRCTDECDTVADRFATLRDLIWDHVESEENRDIVLRRLGVNNGKIEPFESIADSFGISRQAVQQRFDATMIKLFGHTVNGDTMRTIQGGARDGR